MENKREFTGLFAEFGRRMIWTGDILQSEFNYFVRVVLSENGGDYVGKLICHPDHPCANIPYALNNGKGHRHASVLQITDLYKKYGHEIVNGTNN